MREHHVHDTHDHEHGDACGHTAVQHEGHTDYLHEGHLHHAHEGHVDEHNVAVTTHNPNACEAGHACAGHDAAHAHGEGCGHQAVPHGDHVDYLVSGHLHRQHERHCDDHGRLTPA
ncbi:MAG TPA: hypothetical protein VFB22_13905 [Candidatus Baltobacteraceae bacterium]|nr:hypothetical protein [Candidatus Baltobacteraceae bacterium]